MKKIYLLPIVCYLVIISCQKEEIVIPYNCTANMIADQTAQNTITNTGLSLANPVPITGANGTMIDYSTAVFLTESGGLYTGSTINIELVDANDNKDMLLMDFPTVTDNGGLLNSAGILDFKPTDGNGNPLTIDPNNPVFATMTASSNTPMDIWTGTRTNGVLTWNSTPILTGVIDSSWNSNTNTYTYSYNFPITDANVVYNCDDLVSTGQSSNVTVTLPYGKNGSNSTVFCYFRDRNSVVTFYDNDNNGTFEWSSSLPALDVVQFVAISQIEGVREYCVTGFVAIQLTTHQETISKDDMKIALCDDALRLSIKDELE